MTTARERLDAKISAAELRAVERKRERNTKRRKALCKPQRTPRGAKAWATRRANRERRYQLYLTCLRNGAAL